MKKMLYICAAIVAISVASCCGNKKCEKSAVCSDSTAVATACCDSVNADSTYCVKK